MRPRLIVSILGIAFTSVLMLGLPLILLARHQVWSSARDQLRQQTVSIATALEDRLDAGQTVDLGHYLTLLPHRQIIVERANGVRLAAGPQLTHASLQASVRVAGNLITMKAPDGPTVSRARDVTLLVSGIALTALLASVALALWQARRLTRPLAELVAGADRFGRGDFALTPASSGVKEIDRIAHVLGRSSQQIATLIELQRHFAGDAAHQLRTPLTGIGLRLEEIALLGEAAVREEALDALGQVERLDTVITALLARARGNSAEPTELDLAELVKTEAESWRRVLGRERRELQLELGADALVLARRDHILGVLTSLLDNAVNHGAGRVWVATRAVAGSVQLRVRDGGRGVPPDLTQRIYERRFSSVQGTGIGLALARSLAAAEGGTLTVSDDDRAEFVLTLPRRKVALATAPVSKAPIGSDNPPAQLSHLDEWSSGHPEYRC